MQFDNLSKRIYVNKIKIKVKLKTKTRYCLEPLTPETMKLFGSTENTMTKDKNDGNVAHLKITELVLVHCNVVNIGYQQDSRVFYKKFHKQTLPFQKNLIQNFQTWKSGLQMKTVNDWE